MSSFEDPTRRSPADIWAMSREHPSRRHDEMLAERLHFLAAMPDTRRRALRRLMIRLQATWFRSSARQRLRGLSPGSPPGRVAAENDETGIPTRWRGQWTATNKSWTWTPETESSRVRADWDASHLPLAKR